LALLAAPSPSMAAPAVRGIRSPGRTCNLNAPEAQRRMRALKVSPQAGPTIAQPRVLVLRVDFADRPMLSTLAQSQVLFSSAQAFYEENSFGTFSPRFTLSVRSTGGAAGANGTYRLG